MASSRKRVADDGRQTLGKIRKAVAKGTIERLFENENFIFELTDVLYEDSVDISIKTEFLAVLEQYGADSVDVNRAEQVAQRLLDILHEYKSRNEYQRFMVQLLLTVTSLLIQNDMMKSDLCSVLMSQLWEMVSQKNDIATRPVRGCACQCLRQLEIWSPGLLSRHKDRIVQIMREERTHLFQEYATLLSTVLTNISQTINRGESHQGSISAEDVVPHLSYLMENAFLFTPSGLWPIVISVMELVKSTVRVSPTIFKPLMLQNMASLDPCMLHIVLYCQKEFQGEILTAEEERLLLQRLTTEVSLLTLHPAFRLLILQWLKACLQYTGGELLLDNHVMNKLQRALRPSVFDSLDIHVDKLNVLTRTYAADQDQNLLKDMHYLEQLAMTTGNELATAGLYRVFFASYTHHQTQYVADIVNKSTEDLVVKYPHLIPLILDFLLAIREALSDSSVYLATLSSLHEQVLSAEPGEVLRQFRFYLQVLSVSAKQEDIQQHKTLRFLLRLVLHAEEYGKCSWELGCAVLTVCRNLMLHHNSDCIFYELGEVLFEMLTSFNDTEIQNRARMYYALLAGASDEKIREVLGSKIGGGVVLSQNITSILTGSSQTRNKAEIVHMDSRLLVWERLSVTPVFSSSESPSELVKVPCIKGRLESYYRKLAHLSTQIVYQYKLSMAEISEYEELNAVSIRLTSSTEAFLPVPDIHLLTLTKLGSKEVEIKLMPKVPQPTIFKIQIMFATQDHICVSSALQPTEVTFNDLSLVMPWQQLGVVDDQDRHLVFDELWTLMTSDSKGEKSHGVESVKVLKCAADRICQALKVFHLPAKTITDKGLEKFMIFLPPAYHLMLKVFPKGTSQVVSIATDHWQILPCVSSFLNSLDSAT